MRQTAHCTTIALFLLSLVHPGPVSAQNAAVHYGAAVEDSTMTTHATGTFEVKLTPRAADDSTDPAAPGRMAIDKQFHGDLEATSQGQMLAAMSSVKGSGGYVAMERVTGTLNGRRGSFVLLHTGTLTRGAPHLSVTVVPDSGTDELTGLTGSMEIIIEGKQHSYNFSYSISPSS